MKKENVEVYTIYEIVSTEPTKDPLTNCHLLYYRGMVWNESLSHWKASGVSQTLGDELTLNMCHGCPAWDLIGYETKEKAEKALKYMIKHNVLNKNYNNKYSDLKFKVIKFTMRWHSDCAWDHENHIMKKYKK